MDSPELDGSSSSPNVSLTVQSITYTEDQPEEWEIILSDGSFFYIPAAWGTEKGWTEGRLVDGEEIKDLRFQSREARCRRKAAELLGRREQPRKRLGEKLESRGFPGETVRAVLDDLEDRGWLSDERFAQEWLRNRVRKGREGRLKLQALLVQRGVDSGLAERAVRETVTEEAEAAFLERAFEEAVRKYSGDRERIVRYLQRRGFRQSQVYRILDQRSREISGNSC